MLSKAKFSQIIGTNVKNLRLQKGWSQEKLSGECGFYRTSINLVETAKRTPTSFTLYRIARALKVKVGQLYPSTV